MKRMMMAFSALVAIVSLGTVTAVAGPPAQTPSANPATEQAQRQELAKIRSAEALYKRTKAAYTKNPQDAKAKKAYIDATVSLGNVVMFSPALAPRQKYPRALALYREALKLDPKNKTALANKKTIEDIYRQMGRPIPTA